jgi:molybdopterin-guanine dinucleotide biosynthesis protein A
MTAIVLAGGKRDAVAEVDPSAANKAFVAIGGRALVARTIDALRGVTRIDRIVAVAPSQAFMHSALDGVNERRESGPRIADSLRAGLEGSPPDDVVLVAASDLPVLSARAVDGFLDTTLASGADVAYSCVERSVHERRYAEVPHTWAHMRDGDYCGGGVIALRPRAFEALERFLDRLGKARKNPLRLASIFGYDVLGAYALGRLRIADAERRASRLLGATVRAIPCDHPEIAVNVDRRSDVELAERLVRTSSA